jgi:hypothetical protein
MHGPYCHRSTDRSTPSRSTRGSATASPLSRIVLVHATHEDLRRNGQFGSAARARPLQAEHADDRFG